MKKDQALSFKVTSELKKKLVEAARKDERSTSWLVQKILTEWVEKQRKR